MNIRLPLCTLAAIGLLAGRVTAQNGTALTLKDQDDKISYSIGANIGRGLKQQTQQQGLKLKPEVVAAGLKDALAGANTLLSPQEVRETLQALEQQVQGKQAEVGEKNKKDGEVFLAQNKTKPGVKTLPDGLQYQVITEGKGPKPKLSDTVKVNYKGTFLDGTEFDSSDKGPITIPVTGVISGWTEALQMMPVGSKWRLFIPSSLAYKENGAGNVIGPNATLIFEVELVGIEPASKG